MRGWVILIFLYASFLGATLAIGPSMLADHLILFPSRENLPTPHAERLFLKESNLEIWIHRRGNPLADQKIYVLHFIGNASRAEWEEPGFIDSLAKHAFVEAWVLNYPGYGGSPGKATLEALAPSAQASLNAIRSEAGKNKLIVSGNSLGTAAALYLGANNAVDGLVLQNPPPIQNMILSRFGWWNLWLIAAPLAATIPKELDSLSNARKISAPVIFISSERDITVPLKYQKKIIHELKGPHRHLVIPNASHNASFPPSLESEMVSLLGWLLGHSHVENHDRPPT